MNELLYAECVINHFINLGVIENREWENRHPNDQEYNRLV